MFRIFKILIILITIFTINSCGKNFFKRSDVRDNPVNVKERVKRNIEEGRGIRFGIGKNKNGGTFDFASSNELWRATVDTLDFVPLINASYSGGIIITDWFDGGVQEENSPRDLKMTIKFLSNEIRSDALEIIIHERICNKQKTNCTTSLIESKISNEVKVAILKKAAFFEKNKIDKIVKENKKKKTKKKLMSSYKVIT